ncbi:ABC transporter ATP-binding protein [Candidatus Gracilibacteria bacterium]|nr:ABC transporter ATP-binding protein [Candidatus Gracilibacteria bacterium]MCF7898946.1 ABC transporter ATP-binding protein [Candidatus Paceibacterota bacterium]
MNNAVRIENLEKVYRDTKNKKVLHGINLTIPKGQFFGLLGPNGAGKTTIISCITGVSSPTKGSILIFGNDVVSDYREARACIGVSPQEFTIDTFQTVDEILDYQAGFFGVIGSKMKERREEMLIKFDLVSHRDKKFQFLSGGLKRRLTLAKAMMHNPDVLILDEPTAGVDVETRRTLWKFLRELHKGGKTIILTSHYLEEIEELCERVAIIKDGEIIIDDTVSNLTKDKKLEKVYLEAVGHID